MIYVERKDTLYKIVTKIHSKHNNCGKKIMIGKYYNLKLYSNREDAKRIGLAPLNYLDMQCFRYDSTTVICIEPKKGIYDLFYTKSLTGICYAK